MIVSAIVAYAQTPPVPGMCSAPASENRGRPGCYLSAELPVAAGQGDLYWHIRSFDDLRSARAEAARHSVATVVEAHGGTWLYVIGAEDEAIGSGASRAVIGPLRRPAEGPLTARFLESVFPPGMKTRVHSHPGPEAFYVVEGEQCMDAPTNQARSPPAEPIFWTEALTFRPRRADDATWWR